MRKRLDMLLVEKEHFISRTKAQEAIKASRVFVNGKLMKKGSILIAPESLIEILAQTEYVSRAAYKLRDVLQTWPLKIKDQVVLDGGASKGGFTQVLIEKGAQKVFAVDVGHGQMDQKIAQLAGVTVFEGINLRYLSVDLLGELVDLICLDVSFISCLKVIKPLTAVLKDQGEFLILIKPQFEVGPLYINRSGLITSLHQVVSAVRNIVDYLERLNYGVLGFKKAYPRGKTGNQEFFLWAAKNKNQTLPPNYFENVIKNKGS